LEALIKAFKNTCAGLNYALRTERAVRQEAMLLLVAIPLAFFIGSGLWQRVAMIASIIVVIAIELLNTCAEKLCDHVTPERHPQIKIVKDMGSAAVFCALAVAAIIWIAAILERFGA
jgi:diacylglycerol kinase (ATP)